MNKKTTLLIDMDGVFADYYANFLFYWRRLHQDLPFIEAKDLTTFYIEDSYGKEHTSKIHKIVRTPGFFESIPPVEGAIDALQSILAGDMYDPYICTAPELDYVNQECWTEKARYIEKHLGKEWLRRTIITKDKTMIRGAYLIDDKPDIKGSVSPGWQQIVFDHGYNKNVDSILRLNNWAEWDQFQYELLNYHENNKG